MKNKNSSNIAVKKIFYDFSTFWILVLIIFVFSVIGTNFLKPSNLSTILNQASFLLLLGIAQLVVMLTGGINLSIGAVMAMATIICGEMMTEKSGVFFLIPVVIVIAISGSVGLINGLLVTKLRIPSFLATFATMYLARGGAWLYIGAGVYYGINKQLRFIAMGEVCRIGGFRLTMPMAVAFVFVLLISFYLKKQPLDENFILLEQILWPQSLQGYK